MESAFPLEQLISTYPAHVDAKLTLRAQLLDLSLKKYFNLTLSVVPLTSLQHKACLIHTFIQLSQIFTCASFSLQYVTSPTFHVGGIRASPHCRIPSSRETEFPAFFGSLLSRNIISRRVPSWKLEDGTKTTATFKYATEENEWKSRTLIPLIFK